MPYSGAVESNSVATWPAARWRAVLEPSSSPSRVTLQRRTYRLSFDAYSGSWDGNDTDVVQVMAGDRMQLVHVSEEHHVNPGNPALALPVQMMFTAIGPQTNLSFYADIGHCIDIDNVSVTEAGSGSRR